MTKLSEAPVTSPHRRSEHQGLAPLRTEPISNTSAEMKMLLLMLAVGLAAAGRLENTYLPPANADTAGGQNLALPVVRTHTEAVVRPSNEYLPPASAAVTEAVVRRPSNEYLPPVSGSVTEARLQQRPQPLGGSGILRQQGLQSTLGSGSPAPLLPQAAPAQTSAFSGQQSYSFGAQQTALPTTSSFGLQQSSLSKASAFGGFQQQSTLPKATPYVQQQSSFAQQSSFTQQSALPKTPSFSFGSQQSSFSSKPASSASFSAQTSSSFGSQQTSSASAGLRQGGFSSFGSQQQQQQPIAILRSVNVNNGDGSYTYSYQTENGIEAQEQGEFRQDARAGENGGVLSVQGGFAFTAPDNNQRYSLTYTADENGFRAYGDHLPTPPPVPEAILRSIEFNAREEAAQQQQQQQQGYRYQQPQVVDQRQSYQQQQQQGYSYQQPQVDQRQGYQPFQKQQQQQQQQAPASNGGYRY